MSKINSLEFCTKMTSDLDERLVQGATVGFFEDNILKAKFVGAKTVLIPEMDMSGLGDYDRDNGFTVGSIAITSEPYTLTQDRARSFQIDREDNDETGIANLAGKTLPKFVKEHVAPEIDAYTLSKIAGLAKNRDQIVTNADAYLAFMEAVDAVREVAHDEELVCFATRAFLRKLSNADKISRQIVVSNFEKGKVNTQVKMLDDVALLPVPAARMKTAYTFHAGTEGQKDGGFTPAAGATDIDFIVLPKKAASLVKKSETLRVFTPTQNIKADAYKFDYRLYYDVFVKNSMKPAIFAKFKG